LIGLLLAALTRIDLPAAPDSGLAVASDGSVYVGLPNPEGERGALGRYQLVGSKLNRTFAFPGDFSSNLELAVYGSGAALRLFVADFERDTVSSLDFAGRVIWRLRAPGLDGERVDSSGNLWVWVQGGSVLKKTPASSALEPLLDSLGREVFVAGLVDFEPLTRGAYFAIDSLGNLLVADTQSIPKPVARFAGARRVFASRTGGALVVIAAPNRRTRIIYSDKNGKSKLLWESPQGFPEISFATRAGDGRLLLAAPTQSGGVAFLLDAEALQK
jgi:hypothetical protein